MKLFTQLALVSAIAVSGQAMAMQAMDDESMSSATGQDGISLTVVTPGITIDKLLIHDNDGLNAAAATNGGQPGGTNLGGTGTAGAIVVNGVTVGVSTVAGIANPAFGGALARVTIDTDGGGTAGKAVLNINVKTNGIDVGVGGIAVAKSNDVSAMVGARRGAGAETTIISGLNLTIGASELNVQLGAQPQGAMIIANGTIVGGITINSLTLNDNATGGAIGISGLKVTSANSANLAVDTKISVLPGTHPTGGGLKIASTGSNDIYVGGITLGNANSIGSVEVQGLNMGTGSYVLVSGH